MTKKQEKRWNPVAKHAHKFNKGCTMLSKRDKVKRGHVKHKGQELEQ